MYNNNNNDNNKDSGRQICNFGKHEIFFLGVFFVLYLTLLFSSFTLRFRTRFFGIFFLTKQTNFSNVYYATRVKCSSHPHSRVEQLFFVFVSSFAEDPVE